MRHKRLKLSAVLLLGLELTGLQAQIMYVKESSGTQTAYTLSNIQKMSFSSGNLTVTKTDNSSWVFALSDLRYLNFSDITTDLQEDSSVFAQNDTMYIMKSGAIVGQYNVNTEVDSVIFYKPTLEGNITYDSITDIDGNTYKTVTIGTQTWMAENLKVTKYNDGIAIPNVTDDTAWGELTTGALCDYDNTPSNSETYGKLYNWHAVNTGKLCPTGWHVPSDAEWTELTDYLGGRSVAGGKLKETGTTHLASPNTGATNETGFTALPGGFRGYDGAFYYIGYHGYWWSATENGSNNAWYRLMGFNFSTVARHNYYKELGVSVRCVRD
jgi:uncharacterized protein (TIGR02145 family)